MLLRTSALIIVTGLANAGSINVGTNTANWTIGDPSLGVAGGTAYAGYPGGPFIAPFNGSNVCPSSPCSSNWDGFWTATYTFALPADTTSASLIFQSLGADDRAVLELNGTVIGSGSDENGSPEPTGPAIGSMVFMDTGSPMAYTFDSAASPNSGLVTTGFNIGGTNTLMLIVNNTQGGAYGALVNYGYTAAGFLGTVSYTENIASAAPEPGSAMLTVIGIAAFALLRVAIRASRIV